MTNPNGKADTITLLRPKTVARMCGVSGPTVYSWITKGEIVPAYRVEGTEPLFTQEQAERIAVWRMEQSPSPAARIATLEASLRGLIAVMLRRGGRMAAIVSTSPELAPFLPKAED